MRYSIKVFIYKLLCNDITGSLLRGFFRKTLPDIRWPGFRFIVPPKYVNNGIAASVFWGFYESSEIRYIEQYLSGELNVIEFGSSIGIVSSHIASKLQEGKKLIAVEANPLLIDAIRENIDRYVKTGVSYETINKAIGYETATVHLSITTNNTETRIVNDQRGDGIIVNTCGLSDIVQQTGWGEYVLVCDIEGAEAAVLENEKACLQQCRQLFIELHDTVYKGTNYSVEDLVSLITNEHRFQLKDRHGPVCVFAR